MHDRTTDAVRPLRLLIVLVFINSAQEQPFMQGLGGLGPNYLDSPRECRPEMILTALPHAPVRLLRAWPSPSLHACGGRVSKRLV